MELAKPTILVFCDWYRPGYKAGGPITSNVNLVENLGDHFEFKVVCGDTDYLSHQPYANIDSNTWIQVGKAKVLYLPKSDQTKRNIAQIIKAESPSTLYVNGLFSKTFSLFPLLTERRAGCKVIVAPRGMLAPGALGIKPLKKSIFIKLAKAMNWYKDVLFHCTSEDEMGQVRGILNPSAQCVEVPNLPSTIQPKKGSHGKETGVLRLISVTRIAKEKNTLFAIETLGKIPAHISVKAKFIGEVYDPAYFEACKKEVAKIPAHIDIDFAGVMHPDNIPAFFDYADLFFLPTLGENYGHAIVEALLTNTPVLISDKTPWKNLKEDGLGASFALNQPTEFVDYLTRIGEMDAAAYTKTFGQVSISIEERINRQDIRDAYIRLLS